MTQERSGASLRGFASMDVDKQREIARKGGANVPHEKRSFAQDRDLAVDAGRKGGRAIAAESRSFPLTGIWHPKPVAKAVERRKASVDDA
jgi:general stress protein YciG